MNMEQNEKRRNNEDPYQYARRRGEEAAKQGCDWRSNPHLPGTREWFEFDEGLKSQESR
jgi:hypothetical protein